MLYYGPNIPFPLSYVVHEPHEHTNAQKESILIKSNGSRRFYFKNKIKAPLWEVTHTNLKHFVSMQFPYQK